MTLLRWQQNIVDEEGNVLPSATVEIRDEVSGSLVNLFEDIEGVTPKGNPLTADSDGYGFAYMEPGRFKITATSADLAFTKSWRDVRLANDFSDLDSRINQRVIYVGSVAAMVAGGFSVGSAVETLGYYSPGDGGGNQYEIVEGATGTADGGSFIDLSNGNQAKGLFNGGINIRQFGAVCDGSNDDTTAINNSGQFAKSRGGINGMSVDLGPGRFRVSTVVVPDGVVFNGEGERTSRFEKLDADDFSWMAESEDFDADLALNSFAYSDASSLNSGFRNCGFYGLKTYPGTDVTGETIVSGDIDAAGHFQMVIDGGGTATSISGGVKGQPLKLVRGDTDFTVDIGGTDLINKTLTSTDPYLFLTYTGTEWRLTEKIGKISGGVRLYTRRPIMDHVQVFNVLGSGIWLAGPDDGGSANANEMPEGWIGPLYSYRASSYGALISGFHDAVVKSINIGTTYYTGLLCERIDGESACTGEILHSHVYGGRYIGIDIQGPMHFGECVSESNAYEGVRVLYQNTTSTGPTWFTTLQVYSNCNDADLGVNAFRQVQLGQQGTVVGKFIASPASSSAQTIFAVDATANRVQVKGIYITGNATTFAIRNNGNFCQFDGIIHNCSRGLSVAGGAYCIYNLSMQDCDSQVHNLGGDFTNSEFNIKFFAEAGATTWSGTLPTVTQRNSSDLNIDGKIGTDSVRSKFRGSTNLDLSTTGEKKTNINHDLWFTPDISEISFGMRYTGGSFSFTASGTPEAFLGPYTDDITSSYVSVAIYVPTALANTLDASVQIR